MEKKKIVKQNLSKIELRPSLVWRMKHQICYKLPGLSGISNNKIHLPEDLEVL